MKYKELITKLRSKEPVVDNHLLDLAADAIENLQRSVDVHQQLAMKASRLNFKLTDAMLEAEEARAHAEERLEYAAFEFKQAVTELDPCLICVGYKSQENDAECDASDGDCMACQSKTCRCKECRDMNLWQWRGYSFPGILEAAIAGQETLQKQLAEANMKMETLRKKLEQYEA